MFGTVIVGKESCRVVVRDCVHCIKYGSKHKRLQIPYLLILLMMMIDGWKSKARKDD